MQAFPNRQEHGRRRGRQPIRILFWGRFAPSVGGVEVFTQRLGTRLLQRGHEISVITGSGAGDAPDFEVIDGLRVHRVDLSKAVPRSPGEADAMLAALARVAAIKRAARPEVVHINLTDPSSLLHMRSRGGASPDATVVTFQAALDQGFRAGGGMLAALLKRASALVAPSNASADNAAARMGIRRETVSVITPGVPVPPERRGPRPSGPAIVTSVGRLVVDKGVDVAIEAVARVARHHEIRLRIIGDGVERRALETLAEDCGIGELVEFTGRVDDPTLDRMLAESFCLLVPSRHLELFGMVAAEGAIAGLPVIAADTGGLVEIVQHGKTGLVVQADDPDGFAEALRFLLDDRARAEQFGRAGRADALRRFTIETTVDLYEELYRRVISI
jgi:glycosyltransferase involved in cell wall biosynthesis